MKEERKHLNEEIGERIRISREDANYTQERLAEIVGVSVQYISDLERGVSGASVYTLSKICRSLNASCDYVLMGRETDSDPLHMIEFDRLLRLAPEKKRALVNIMNLFLDATLKE